MNTITFSVPAALTIEADDSGERRLVAGVAVPWGVVGNTSAGPVEFAPDALPDATGVPVVRGHNDDALIGSVRASSSDANGMAVRARLSKTALADETLALAADGVLAGFSVSAAPIEYSLREDPVEGQVMHVLSAEWRHLGVVQQPAYTEAQIQTVAASHTTKEDAVEATVTPTEPVPPPPDPMPEEPEMIQAAVARVTAEAFPYAFNGTGPSLLRDYFMAQEGDQQAASRVMKAQAMLRDPRLVLQASQSMAKRIDAATGTTVTQPSIVPPVYRPDLYTPLIAYEAPVYSATTKQPINDFTPFVIPREATRTGLSTTPTDEVTPVAAGDITTTTNTVTPVHVMGSYAFSRDLALSSNPGIDMIAMNAMDQSWLLDIESRAIAYFEGAGHNTAKAPTYTTGIAFVKDARGELASFRTTRRAPADVIICPTAEYLAAVNADDSSARPLLGWGQNVMNPVGRVGDGAQEASILGVPLVPEGQSPLGAKKTHYVHIADAWCFTTPVWNFRFDASGTNPLVITLVKYSGVAFWTRYVEGYVVATNAGANPTVEGFDMGDSADETTTSRTKK
jgi:HK97 family phage prohead protease